jgi:hypothetical protein
VTRTAVSSPAGVRTAEGGKGESGSGHTVVPSSRISYAVAVPGVSPLTGTSA